MKQKQFIIALAGNPNCGKTTVFNALTGAKQYVGNWPGVTVERKEGFFEFQNSEFKVIDLPGIYSFSAYSLDEKVSREYILLEKPDLVINIVVEPDVLVERLTGRRVCRDCGANHHLRFNAPSRQGVCDACGGELYQRDDDNEETVRNRLDVYSRQTEPLIAYYRPGGRLVSVDGSRTPDEVFAEITDAIDTAAARGGQ